jgi:phosphoribosylamine--glycine ligase
MKILVVGGGGREHAVIRKLKESPRAEKIYCAPGNGGIGCDAENVPIAAMNIAGMVDFAKKNGIGMVCVTPDDPLAAGMADAFTEAGIPAFGPSRAAAQIEASKVFSKNLMKKYGIPTAGYEVFDTPEKTLAYIKQQNQFPVVIKADGLALGKGVIIAQNFAEAEDAVKTIMEDKVFGASGNKVVVEEFLTGPEVSVLAFTDGKTLKPMVSSKDHKRALDGNKGKKTLAAWAQSARILPIRPLWPMNV